MVRPGGQHNHDRCDLPVALPALPGQCRGQGFAMDRLHCHRCGGAPVCVQCGRSPDGVSVQQSREKEATGTDLPEAAAPGI